MNESSNREQAVRLLEASRAELQRKLEQAKHDLEAMEHSIRLLRGIGQGSPREETPADGVYSDLRPQQAVDKFFQEHPQRAYKPSQAARMLRESGYQPTTRDRNVFVTQVRTACLRLTQKGVLERTEVDGKAAFRFAGGQNAP